MERDFLDEKLTVAVVVRMFPADIDRLTEIVKDSEKYENNSHAIRCAIQAFLRKWGDV